MIEKKMKTSPDYALLAQRSLEASSEGEASKPGLYVVATPIGNLGDISLRALKTLADSDLVLCEDTRVTGGLLHKYGIKKPLLSYHDHNAKERLPEVIAQLKAGKLVALVSDAGTPLVSDPGYKLVQACRTEGLNVVAVPGASALLTALACAGLPTDKFLFAGFLPPKKTGRQKALAEMKEIPATLVFYEAPTRLKETLADMKEVLGPQRLAVIGRELTKLFEELQLAPLAELAALYAVSPTPKGEIVIVVGPPAEDEPAEADIEKLLRLQLRTQSLRDAVASVAGKTGAKKSVVYQKALALEPAKTHR